MDRSIENLTISSNVLMEVVYRYFALLKREGTTDYQFMTKVGDVDVLIQYDDDSDRVVVTVPREDDKWTPPEDPIERAEFPVTALTQVVAIYFKKRIMEDRGNFDVVKVDGKRYNVWFDDQDQEVKISIDKQDRKEDD
jgi:hypothetical protein